jgi:hypothetical protein
MSVNITGLQSASSPYAIAPVTVSPYDTNSLAQNLLTDPNGPLANLNLTSQQQTQIQQLLSQNPGSASQTPTQIFKQLENILTPQQQEQLKTNLETSSAQHHHHHHQSSSSTASASEPSTTAAYTVTGSVPADSAAASNFETNA